MSICEVTLKLHKQTGFNTHASYCRWMGLSLSDDKLNFVKKHISIISIVLTNIFSMNPKDAGEYIADYFILEKFLIFEKIVNTTKYCYPTINDLY